MDIKRPIIFMNAPLSEDGMSRLRTMFELIFEDEKQRYRERVEAIVTVGGKCVNAQLMDAFPSAKLIATRGVGFDHIDVKAAHQRGIVVSNTPEVLSDCVADLAMGVLIALARKVMDADRFVRHGHWPTQVFPMGVKVSGKRLGIVGFGRIGKAVAKRASAFDMDIRYVSRTHYVECTERYEASLVALASWADYLVVCAPGGESTRHLISREILNALGNKGFIINIARGSLIDEAALIEALQNKTIAGAALDVFENEPYVPRELIDSDKVILLPHIASRTHETFRAMEELLIDNLHRYFTKGAVLTPVKEG